MKYDFTSIMDRRGKDALAIDGIGENKVWGNEPDAPKEPELRSCRPRKVNLLLLTFFRLL